MAGSIRPVVASSPLLKFTRPHYLGSPSDPSACRPFTPGSLAHGERQKSGGPVNILSDLPGLNLDLRCGSRACREALRF